MSVRYPGGSAGHLVEAVMARIQEVHADSRLPAKTGELVPIKVTRAYFDPEQYEQYEWPADLVHFRGVTQSRNDDGSETRVGEVDIVLGVFLSDYGDDEFAIALMERIEQDLLAQRILDRKYRLALPLTWTVPEAGDQPWPYWWATMSASFWMPAIAEVRNENGEPFEI